MRGPAAATAQARARRTSAAPSTRSCRSRTATDGGSSTSSGGIGTIRCHGHWPSSARKHFVNSRPSGCRPRAGCTRARFGPGSTPHMRSATYASIDVERSAGPSNQIDHVPSSRMRAISSFAIRRSRSGVRRPRTWFQKRCCAVIVTFDSSSPTQMPSGRCSSSRRRVPRSIASSSAVSCAVALTR